jgi:hypothetical protein
MSNSRISAAPWIPAFSLQDAIETSSFPQTGYRPVRFENSLIFFSGLFELLLVSCEDRKEFSMIRPSHNRFVCLTLFGPCILCLAGLSIKAHQLEALARLPYGRYTEEQISQRSVSLCSLLLQNPQQINLTSSRTQAFSPPSTVRHVWEVEASSPSHQPVAHLTWDADTGELSMITLELQQVERTGFRIDSRKAAIGNAWSWMEALGFAQTARDWKLDGSPEKNSKVWMVGWKSGGRKVSIEFDAVSSCFIMAHSYQPHSISQ